MFTIFLKYTPAHFGKLPTRLKLQFAFSQLWYPLFSVLMLIMYLLPIAALLFDSNMVGVTYPDFFLHATLLWIVLIIMAFWWRKQQWLRPVDVKILSWEGTLFLYARWPWSLIGTFAAVLDWLRGNTLEFRVTPKERAAVEQLPLRVLAPYAFLSLASGLPVLLLGNVKVAVGFYLFAAINCLLYAILVAVIIVMHRRENQESSAIFRVNDSAIDRAVAIS